MPVVALAYHENIAVEKLNRYFATATAAGGDSRAITCSKCSLAFGVVRGIVNFAKGRAVPALRTTDKRPD
jgi:hypothetical protein